MPINLDHATKTFTTDSGPLTIGIDSAVRIPIGAQSSRPIGLAGHLRFDTDTNQFEGFDGTQWGPLAGNIGSTTDITEGSNLYYTNERVDDRVSNLLIAGSGIQLVYNDSANTLTVSSSLSIENSNASVTDATTLNFIGNGVSATDAGNGVVNISVTGAGIGNTDDVPEGLTNLYYTNARVSSFVDKPYIDSLNVDANTLGGNSVSYFQRRTQIADSPPVSAEEGDLWVDSETGELYVYYVDINSSQWIGINSQGSDQPPNTSPFVDTGSFVYYGGPRNVGIGTSTPSEALEVIGNIQASGDVIAYSDKRLKHSISTIDNSIEIVKKLRGVRFSRHDEFRRHIGLIAQEVEEVIPEVVHLNKETGYLGVSYGNLVGVLIEAIKSQQIQIDALQKIIEMK